MLVYETKQVFSVDYRKLDEFLTEEYGQKFEFIADYECMNDTCHRISVSGCLSHYNESRFNQWVQGVHYNYMAGTLMNKACQEGKIPAGEYIIDVSW